jgi:hypothetical protein
MTDQRVCEENTNVKGRHASISFLDHSYPTSLLGRAPEPGEDLSLVVPTNDQSAIATSRNFIDAAATAAGAPAK